MAVLESARTKPPASRSAGTKHGNVIWSTTQESQGGKFRRASTDVADRITKKLVEDYQRAKKLRSSSPETAPSPR